MKLLMKRGLAISLIIVLVLVCGLCLYFTPTLRINQIVSKMSLEQKLAQMMMISIRSFDEDPNVEEKTPVTELPEKLKDTIAKYDLGGVILFRENCAGTEQTLRLTDDLQKAILSKNSVTQIPLLIATDQEGGSVVRLQTGTSLPGNMALAATGDANNANVAAQIIGKELKVLGINTNFGPDIDVNNNPANPVIGIRSFSEDPKEVAEYSTEYLKGLHSTGTISTIKHFPGHGDTETDSHSGLPSISKTYDQLTELELVPFKAAIEAGTEIVMTAHIQYPLIERETYTSCETGEEITLPATLSKTFITDILRGELGFDGVVVTDDMEMDAITKNFERIDAAKLAINAGVDIILEPVGVTSPEGIEELGEYIDTLAELVRSGEISEENINTSVKRILMMKAKNGLYNYESDDVESRVDNAKAIVGCKSHHDIEWSLAKSAVTSVADKDTFPIKADGKDSVLLLCPYENETLLMKYGINKLVEDHILTSDEVVSDISVYQDKTVEDFKKQIDKVEYIIAVSEIYSEAAMNPENESSWQVRFLDELIDICNTKRKKVIIISAALPYDANRYPEADGVLVVYGDRGMNELPTAFDGETRTYGVNIAAGVYGAFSGEADGVLPVTVPQQYKN